MTSYGLQPRDLPLDDLLRESARVVALELQPTAGERVALAEELLARASRRAWEPQGDATVVVLASGERIFMRCRLTRGGWRWEQS